MQDNRICGECTECCKGWVTFQNEILNAYPGKPCHHLGCGGCTIYSQRPIDPCRQYVCEWLMDPVLPLWMRPDRSGVIISKQAIDDMVFWDIAECGKTMSVDVLDFLLRLYFAGKAPNLRYRIHGHPRYIGDEKVYVQTLKT